MSQPRDDNGRFQSNQNTNTNMSNNNGKQNQNQQNASTVSRVRSVAENNLEDVTANVVRGVATVGSLAYLFTLFGDVHLPLSESIMALFFVTLAGVHAYTRTPGERLDTEVASYVGVGFILGMIQLGVLSIPFPPKELGGLLLLIVTAGGYVFRGNRHDRRPEATGQ